jgi:hypothetical protein
MMVKNDNKDDNKEEFCAPCLMAVPAALGVGGAASSGKGSDKKKKSIMLWSGIALTVISIIVFIYLKKKCKKCR